MYDSRDVRRLSPGDRTGHQALMLPLTSLVFQAVRRPRGILTGLWYILRSATDRRLGAVPTGAQYASDERQATTVIACSSPSWCRDIIDGSRRKHGFGTIVLRGRRTSAE